MRIQRALARAGVASRRKAEELIAAGRVRVNGEVARTGQIVDPSRDEIVVDGRTVEAPRSTVWYALNKPAGVMTTRSDPDGRRTVFELVPDVRSRDVYVCGPPGMTRYVLRAMRELRVPVRQLHYEDFEMA